MHVPKNRGRPIIIKLYIMMRYDHQTIWLMTIILLIILTNFVGAQLGIPINICTNTNGNYTSDSTYRTNLNTVLSSLPPNMSPQGFHNASVGDDPNQANAIALCRTDVQPDACRSCIQIAISDIISACPNQKEAIEWRELCTLRYSNQLIYGIMAVQPDWVTYLKYTVMVVNPYLEDVTKLLDGLRGKVAAAAGGSSSLMKVAIGEVKTRDFQTIYALVQCSPDISPDDCGRCLTSAMGYIPQFNYSRLLVIDLPSCYLRYAESKFYNTSRITEAQVGTSVGAPAPSPPTPPSLPTTVQPSPPSGNKNRTVIIIVVVVIVSLIIIVVCIGLFMRKKRNHKAKESIKNDDHEDMRTAESLQYDFGKIRAATNDFSDSSKLGQGGFGAVYKGTLQNGQNIAVKRLSKGSSQGDLEFKNEVVLVAQLQHRNLVRLLGFALEATERLLVYELMENASLDHFIFDPIRRSQMDWGTRWKIIGGIARGLLYLHEDSRLRIIHRDLKAANILLDAEMNPKIADFGMARLFKIDESERITNRVVGTYGYMAPEYAMHGQFSVKSDVFSFGVLVLEIISGQMNINTFRNGKNIESMLSFAWTNWREGTTINMVDPLLRATSGSLQDALRCIQIGLLCVQENAIDRPTMASVVNMLNSLSIKLQEPSQPALFIPYSTDEDTTTSSVLRYNKSTLSPKTDESDVGDLYPH